MAFIDDSDKLKDEQQQINQPQLPNQPQFGGQDGGGFVGQTGVGADVSTAGVGAGGTGGWVNVQSYLNANKGDTGTADYLNKQVGSQFDKERSDISSQSEKAKSQGAEVVGSVNEASKNASDWLKQAAQNYSWNGNQNDTYNQNVGNIKNTLAAKYTGPTSWDYGISADSQKYAGSLGDRPAFDQLVGDFNQQRGGGQLSSGGRELQKQLDISNPAIEQARQNLLQQYSDLGNYRDQTVKGTADDLANSEKQFRTNQNSLRDWLNNQAANDQSTIAKKESDAKFASDQNFNSISGGYDLGWKNPVAYNPYNGLVQNANPWSDLSFRDMKNRYDGGQMPEWGNVPTGNQRVGGEARAVLDQFNNIENERFAGTGRDEKQDFNTLQEILGSNQKQNKDFQVREKFKYGNQR